MADTQNTKATKYPKKTVRLLMWDISSNFADRLFAASNILLIVGAAAVLVGTIGAIVMSGVREQFYNERISANERDTAVATRDAAAASERAALAEQRAAEANLELEKLRAPRALSSEQQHRISEKIRFAPTRFDISVIVGDPEAVFFLTQITEPLEAGGWTWIEYNHPTGPFMNVYSLPGKPNIGQAGVSTGVRVEIHPDRLGEFGDASAALVSALAAEGIAVGAGPAGEDVPNHDTLHIKIGRKPM